MGYLNQNFPPREVEQNVPREKQQMKRAMASALLNGKFDDAKGYATAWHDLNVTGAEKRREIFIQAFAADPSQFTEPEPLKALA